MSDSTTPNEAGTSHKPRGRKVPPLPTFTFKDVDVTVSIRRLGPFTLDELRKVLRKERKPPEVPEIEVEVGEARAKLKERNPQDPQYIQQVIEYNEWLNTTIAEKMLNLMINYSIVVEPEPEIVEEKRSMLALIDPDINERFSDKEVYIQYYLLTSTNVLNEVQQFIMGQSMPVPEAVQQHIDTFPGSVQGEGPVRTPGTPIGV